MALRLVVEFGDGIRRIPLAEGENLLGSGLGCLVRIAHPSVSRRHAIIRVCEGRAEIEDLGSHNGTRIAGRRFAGPAPLALDQALSFGAVDARLEQVQAKDLEAAVAFSSVANVVEPEVEPASSKTAGIGSLQDFTLESLPSLLNLLATEGGSERMSLALGAALFKTLPCLAVEILSPRGGQWFHASHEPDWVGNAIEARSETPAGTIIATFLHPLQARSYDGLIDIAGSFLQLASQATPELPPRSGPRSQVPLPEPATVVPAVRQIYADARRVAHGDISVLIRGASGTGKEVLARHLHLASERHERSFVALNCAALPRELLESELFGVERGVATGVDSRPGKFELADGGTLFLDEIGDMALDTQARILRVLQEGEFYRLGGQKSRSVDVRVIAATHRDLESMIRTEEFRSDLFHRIADWTVSLPSLVDRRADIPNLAAYFLSQEGKKRGLELAGISRGAMERLMAFDWPGNIRQLEREMARSALFLDPGQLLESSHLQTAILSANGGPASSLKQRLERAERQEIIAALDECQWSVPKTAAQLQMGVSTLYRRMRELGIEAVD